MADLPDGQKSSPEGSFRKSSFSAKDDCVEVAMSEAMICVRDSKDGSGPVLRFSVSEWRAFVAGVREGEFDAT